MSKNRSENSNKTKPGDTGDPKPENKAAPKPRSKARPKDKPTSNHKENNDQNIPPGKMEVHHHPQLDHKPKPWKEYLIEGGMIFIAVMMGFIAENIRETITNSEHARQLTTQLVQDLKVDTALLQKTYVGEIKIVKYNDSLFALLQQPLAKVDTRKLQRLVAGSHTLWLFRPSAGAIAAIKNELYLKQFSNSEIINHIALYERVIGMLQVAQDITLKYQRSFLDPFLLNHFTPANLQASFDMPPVPTAEMRNLTQEDLTQLGASMVLVRINTNELISNNRQVMTEALDLLHYVTRQYDLE